MKTKVMASPDGALSFLFGIFGLLIWYTSVHYPTLDELATAAGLWLILSLGALSASLINMFRGKSRGNINLLATLLLGFFPGVNALIALIAQVYGFVYDPKIIGLVYIAGSIFCFGMSWPRLDKPLYRYGGTLAIALGLLSLGIWNLSGITFFMKAGGWCCLIFSLYMFYYGLSVMYFFFDARLPQGMVLKKNRLSENYDYELDEERAKAIQIHLKTFSNPGMILAFISCVFGLMNFASAVWSMNVDEELAMAVVRLMLGAIHFMAALVLILKGNPSGNMTLILAVCFALFSGGRKMIGLFESSLPISITPGMYGMLQLFAGMYISACLPAVKNQPLYQWIASWLSAIGLVFFGLSELLGLGFLSILAGWMYLAFAIISIYTGLSNIIPDLPQGKIWQGFAFLRQDPAE